MKLETNRKKKEREKIDYKKCIIKFTYLI